MQRFLLHSVVTKLTRTSLAIKTSSYNFMTINGKAKVIALLYKGTLTRMLTWGKKRFKDNRRKKRSKQKPKKIKERIGVGKVCNFTNFIQFIKKLSNI